MSLAFLFPGQGAQYVGMASDLYKASPIAQYVFNLTDRISETGLKTFCFDGPEESLKQTAITQPAIFAHSISVFEILKDRGIHPDFVAGHSVGELSALVAAGVMSLEDGVRIVGIRGRAMHAAGKMHPGTMAAIIGLSDSAVADLCQSLGPKGMVVPANFNCPGQVVISGEPTAIKRAMRKALEEGARRVVELAGQRRFSLGAYANRAGHAGRRPRKRAILAGAHPGGAEHDGRTHNRSGPAQRPPCQTGCLARPMDGFDGADCFGRRGPRD